MKENTSSGAKTSEKKNRREKNKIIGTIRQGGCADPSLLQLGQEVNL